MKLLFLALIFVILCYSKQSPVLPTTCKQDSQCISGFHCKYPLQRYSGYQYTRQCVDKGKCTDNSSCGQGFRCKLVLNRQMQSSKVCRANRCVEHYECGEGTCFKGACNGLKSSVMTD